MDELSNLELLTTTRAVRRRLDLTRPVERATVTECLQVAFQAPNASNQQRWAWVVVDDGPTRAAMADVYRAGMAEREAQIAALAGTAGEYTVTTGDTMRASVAHLRAHLHEVPVLVVPTVVGRLEGTDVATQASAWGSVLPAVWSFMLALRTRGLGSVWTTVHLQREAEMAELLGIPFASVTQVGLFPVAYTVGTVFRPGSRQASGDVIRWNRW